MRRWPYTLLALCYAGCAAASAQTTDLNLDETLAPIRSRLAAGETVGILVLGDSLTLRDHGWFYPFRSNLQAVYGDAGDGVQGFSVWSGAGMGEGWIRGVVNQDTPPHHSLDGLWASSSAGPYPPLHSDAVFHARSRVISLYYTMAPGNGSFGLTFPDGSTAVINCDGPETTVAAFDYAFPGDGRDLGVQPLGDGPITILGENNISGNPGPLVHRAANGGWGVGNFLARDCTFDQEVALLHPDLVMIFLGQNDQGFGRAGYTQAMGDLVDRVLLSAPAARCLLIGTYDSGSERIPDLVGGVEDLARARTLGFLSLYEVGGTYEYFLSHGYLDDGLHFSEAGGRYVAGFITRAFLEEGRAYCAPVVTVQPVARSVHINGSIRLSLDVAAGRAPRIRWRKGGVDLEEGGAISGSTTLHLTISPASLADSGLYDAVVSNECGEAVSVAVEEVVLPGCAADFNSDGRVDSQDFFDFVAAFLAGDPRADTDGSGVVDSQDFFDFIVVFFGGC